MTFFVVPSEIRHLHESDGIKSPVRGVTGFWLLLPILGVFIWFVKVQGALNHNWRMQAAGA